MNKIASKISEGYQFFRFLQFQSANAFDNKNISIFGISRGGTTWLAEILKTIPHSTLVWEPLFRYRQYSINRLNPFAYPEQVIKGFGWNQHIPQNNSWPEAVMFFDKLFTREIRNLKILRFNDIPKIKFNEDIFIYKFCFGNLLLPWLVDKYQIKPILLIRHPAAVIDSSLNFGNHFDWHKRNPKVIIDQNQRFNPDFLLKYQDVIPLVKTPEALLAFQWVIQYDYLINHPYNNKKWLTVSYERLYMNPKEEIHRIFTYLNTQIPDDIWTKIKKVSFSSSRDHSKSQIEKGEQLIKWKQKLSGEQVKNIFEILEMVGINFYNENSEPDYKILYSSK